MDDSWRLARIRHMPDLAALLAITVSLMVIAHRAVTAAAAKNLDFFRSAFDGFPIFFGLVGASFVAISIWLQPRTTSDAKKLRTTYKEDGTTFAAQAIADADYAWPLANAVDKELEDLDRRIGQYETARLKAVRRYETIGTYVLLAATVLAFLNWVLGVA